MSEDMEAKVWEKRMPDLTPAEQLAVEIDRFSHVMIFIPTATITQI